MTTEELDWLSIAVPGCAHFEGTGPNTHGDCIKPYVCPAGKVTVLYGHVVNEGEEKKYLAGESIAKAHDLILAAHNGKPVGKAFLDKCAGWTHEQAKEVLAQQLFSFGKAVKELCIATPDPHKLAALTMLAYNIGVGAFAKSSVLKLQNDPHAELKAIGAAFEMWDKATVNGKLTVLEGLKRRRRAEYFIYAGGSIADLDAKGWIV